MTILSEINLLDIITKDNFGKNPATWNMGNFDGDNDVDWNDLQAVMANFGTRETSQAQTPEPASLILFSAMFLPCNYEKKEEIKLSGNNPLFIKINLIYQIIL